LNALGRIIDLILKRTRRSDTLQFLFDDAAKKKTPAHMPPPPFSKAAPLGALLPLPCSVGDAVADIRDTGRSAIRWNQTLFKNKWARGMWQWAFRCIKKDLKSSNHSDDMSMLVEAVVDGSFDRLVDLYKQRHAEAAKLVAALAACATNTRKSSRSNPTPLDADAADLAVLQQEKQEADKASLFVPLLLNDPLDEALEWELSGLEVATPTKITLLARRLASLELTLESRREPLNNIERKMLTADYVRFVGWKHQGVFLSHMGRFQSSSLLARVDNSSGVDIDATEEKSKGNRWLFGFGGGKKNAADGGKPTDTQSSGNRPNSPEEGSRYQFTAKNAAVSIGESGDEGEVQDESVPSTGAEDTTTEIDNVENASDAEAAPATEENKFLASVGFNSDEEDEDSGDEVRQSHVLCLYAAHGFHIFYRCLYLLSFHVNMSSFFYPFIYLFLNLQV
jgi:hypothetical protein